MPVTTGMKAGGFYDAHSNVQRFAMEPYLPWLEEAMAQLPEPHAGTGAHAFLDLGSSEGSNALYAANRAIQALRRHRRTPVQLWFDDIPTNNFNQLFANLFPPGQPAPMADDIFPAAVAGSMFGRVAPAKSLHVATTFNAINFLETRPAAVPPRCIHPNFLFGQSEGVTLTREEQAPFLEESRRNLRSFYAARAEELVPGGKLLIQVFSRNDQHTTADGPYGTLGDAVLSLVEEGYFQRDFYARLFCPVYMRALEEFLEPIEQDAALAACFRVEKSGSEETPIPFNDKFDEDGDAKAWAEEYTAHFRAFTEGMLVGQVPEDRPAQEALDRIYGRCVDLLVADPAHYRMHYISAGVLLTRL